MQQVKLLANTSIYTSRFFTDFFAHAPVCLSDIQMWLHMIIMFWFQQPGLNSLSSQRKDSYKDAGYMYFVHVQSLHPDLLQ